ncbi:MAG: hypothetical protein QM734_16895 [Cyclobacteriaceae bacterium]
MCGRIEITLRKVVNFSQHGKYLKPLTGKVSVIRLLLVFVLFIAIQENTYAQERPIKAPARLQANSDSVGQKRTSLADTSKVKKDTVNNKAKSDIESTVVYSADDSIISELKRKIVRLYGNAKVTYGNIKLDAEEIIIDYENSTITANGKKDSTGQLVGFPIFKEGEQTYETKGMVYNFKNKKAKITQVVTKQSEGFMHGEQVFKDPEKQSLHYRQCVYHMRSCRPPFQNNIKKSESNPGR